MSISFFQRRRFLQALFGATLGVIAAPSIAGGVGRALTRGVMRKLNPAVRSTLQSGGKPATVIISRRRYPDAAAHVEHAQKNGQPTVLTLDRQGTAARRSESLRGVGENGHRPGPGFDRDEYPFAATREGGSGADVRYIPAEQNRGAGASFAHQVRGLPDGSRIQVVPTE